MSNLKRTTSRAGPMTFRRDSSPKRLRRTQSTYAAPQAAYRAALRSKETGYVDTVVTPIAGNTTGTIALLNTVAAGTGVTQRVGKKLQLKGIQVRGQMNSDTATVFSHYCMMLVMDRRPAGALPAITDILVSISAQSFLNDANSARFKIVKRWDQIGIGNSSAYSDLSAQCYNEYVKFPKKANFTTYKAAGTGAIDDIDEGALYFVCCGSNAAGTTDTTGTMNFRLRFWDV